MASPRSKASASQAAPPPAPPSAAPLPPSAAARAPIMPLIPGRVVALNRAGKPIQRAAAETGVDQFHIPPHLPPPGWSWEWKEDTVVGEIRHGEAAKQAQVGWESVMAESYPGVFMPEFNDKGEPARGPIRRGGLMLKERPMALTLEAKADEDRRANERVNSSKYQYTKRLSDAARTTQTAEFDDEARRVSSIRQSREVVDYPQANPAGPGIPQPYRQPID